ncbi:ATPase, T2SS/T4P/T4SS family [Ruegeria sp.]|uniref:ATPase, T2SS/T4P/T4SS family n=1 Tax=Ruegeria sp. TaxID=1879320 RepID=UPI003B00804E
MLDDQGKPRAGTADRPRRPRPGRLGAWIGGWLGAWLGTLRPQMDAALERAGLSGLTGQRPTPPLSKGGAFDIGSEPFRKACALLEDGTVCLVRAWNTGEVAAELVALRARYDLPDERDRRAVTAAQISAFYGDETKALVRHTPGGGQLRLKRALQEAAALGASDIKLIERKTHGLLRIKVGSGEFTHGSEWPLEDVVAAIDWAHGNRDGGGGTPTKLLGVPDSFSLGQSGEFTGMPKGIAALRGQLAWHGDNRHFLNLRLLPKADAAQFGNLAGLGLEADILEALAAERRSESGLVILGGSTGDGKSTTLVRHLERLYAERDGRISLYTIEDPVEYPALGDGVIQFPVVPGKTPQERMANFSRMLMTFVRTNPDVGMVSEIRSAADVNEVLHFVTSGHKIYTTVHANSAIGVLFRLIALGVRPSELAGPDVVNMVMRQKLVPELCPHCADVLSGPARARVEDWLGEEALFVAQKRPGPLTLLRRNHKGCAHCLAPYANLSGAIAQTAKAAWAGYCGRRATAELIRLDNDYRKLVNAQDQIGALEYWQMPVAEGGMGGLSLATRLRRLVASGVTDFEHVTNEALPDPLPAITGPKRAARQTGDGS